MTSMTLPSARPGPVSRALSLLRTRPRESAGAGLLALAACLSVAAFANDSRALPVQPQAPVDAGAPSVQEMTPTAVTSNTSERTNLERIIGGTGVGVRWLPGQ